MNDKVKAIIDAVFDGNSAQVKDHIEASLNDRVLAALEDRKKEVAQAYFQPKEE